MSHSGHKVPSTRTPFDNRNIMQTEINEPKEGDYFSIKKNGEDWPILICDEEIVQTFFAYPLRPESARSADGTWGEDYKAGGASISDRHYPAITLGTMKFMWTRLKELEPIDIDIGRVIRSSTTNPLLEKAWAEYIGQYDGDKFNKWKDLKHWKTRLHMQTGEVKKEKLSNGKMNRVLKRKGTPKFKYPPGYHNEEKDDEESDDLFLPKSNGFGPKIKRESINSSSSEEMNALYDDDADPLHPTSSQSSKRSKLDRSGHFSTRPSTPLGAGSGKLATPMTSARHVTPFQSSYKDLNVNDPNAVVIYVDNPHKRFKVGRGGLDASPLLSKLLTYHPDNGWYIMSPLLSAIQANDFQPIGEYIDRREYHPNILDDGTVHVRLEGDLSPELLQQELVRCGTIYQVAKMLEMPDLQDLAFRKLKALTPHYQAREMLTVIELLFGVGSPEVRQYLTQHVAEHYWYLVLAETERAVEVMRGNEELAKGVFRMLSGPDDKVKREEDAVKGEGKEEVLFEDRKGGIVEAMGPEETVGESEGRRETRRSRAKAARADADADADADAATTDNADGNGRPPADTMKPGTGPSVGLSRAERDMLRMALYGSEGEFPSRGTGGVGYAAPTVEDDVDGASSNEDELMRLVRKQVDLF